MTNPGLTQGQVPTPAQWNSYFDMKQDVLGFVPLSAGGGTLQGQVTLAASTAVQSGINVPPGVAPASPNNGDIWTTASGLFARIAGSTINISGGVITSFAGGTLTGPLTTAPSALSGAGLNIAPGTVPSTPNNGDLWVTSSGLFARIGGSTLNVSQPANIDALTLKATPASADELIIWDTVGLANKKITVGSVSPVGLPADVLKSDVTATITVGYTFTPNNAGTLSSGTLTPNPALGNYQFLTNNGAFTVAAPSSDCAIDILITNGASAGTISFSGFTVGSNTGDPLTNTNTSKFILSIRRINAVSTYGTKALQ